jgi:hypothetical protein
MRLNTSKIKKYNKLADKNPVMVRVGHTWYTWYEGGKNSAFLTTQRGKDVEFDYDQIDDIQESTMKLTKSKLKEMIKGEILKEQGVADEDAKAALKIKKDLMKIGKFIETGFAMIDKSLSSFNAPGLKTWFYQAIVKGVSRNKFDRRAFEKELEDWYRYRR